MQKRTFALAAVVTVFLIGAAAAATALTSRPSATPPVVENVFDRPLHCDQLPGLDSIPLGQSNIIDDWREECALEVLVAQK